MQGTNHTQRERLMSILGSRTRNQRSNLGPQLWLMSWQVNACLQGGASCATSTPKGAVS